MDDDRIVVVDGIVAVDDDRIVDTLGDAIEQGTLTERQILICRVGVRLGRGVMMPDQIDDFGFTPQEKIEVNALARAVILAEADEQRAAWKRRAPARRRAMRLLRSFLTPEQRARLRRSRDFLAVGSAGGVYRLAPYRGNTERVTRHGRKWFVFESFCLHDERDGDAMPHPDLVLAHLLLLTADEPAFLALANARNHRDALWNGDYLRRMRAARQTRLADGEQTTRDVAAAVAA